MSKRLVIVESPTKAKTVKRILGDAYAVTSSYGHIRDLPKSKIGVDVEHDYAPTYTIPAKQKTRVTELKSLANAAEDIYIATDDDREGEAIGWHLAHVLGIDPAKAHRIVFHEITKRAIEEAIGHPRPLNMDKVDAQQARRILDRLVGYELSPFLWKKVARGLSAGRVQSVAVRFVVERERERDTFKTEEYWSLDATMEHAPSHTPFIAKLAMYHGNKVEKMDIKTTTQAKEMTDALRTASYTVTAVERKEAKKYPKPPYRTSTLQQDANTRLGYSSKQTMRLAQQLYEGVALGKDGMTGLITYMRTDSLNMADQFLSEASDYIVRTFGKEYGIPAPRHFKNTSKGAQEAHEAIRPTDPARTPESIRDHLDPQQYKLYDLIWRRAMATQMAEARIAKEQADIGSDVGTFRATGSSVQFAGYLKLYPDLAKDTILPVMKQDDAVHLSELLPAQHFTEPPARYSDATLVKAMEEHGIGRPSTYAPTISTIVDRGYVERDEGKRLKPMDIAYTVNDLLVEHFANIVDKEFTAKMEQQLDDVEDGKTEWVPVIDAFYKPFHKNLELKTKEIDKKELTEEASDEVCEKCGSPMVVKIGRFGKFLACSNYPACKHTIALEKDGSKRQEVEPTVLGTDPETSKPITLRTGRFGPYVQVGEAEGKIKPKRASVLRNMNVTDVDLAIALKLLSLPRTVGTFNNQPITAQIGRFGPYIKAGEESRSIPKDSAFTVLDVTEEQAIELLKKPKVSRKGRRSPSAS